MTTLTVYEESGRNTPITATDEPRRIQSELAEIGVAFERWDAPFALPPHIEPDAVMKLYTPTINRLKVGGGYSTCDVVRVLPTSPKAAELRATFLEEHTHEDDEVRFFIEGGGTFFLRSDSKVLELRAHRGDLIRIPGGKRHWYDCGLPPFFTALRLFTRPEGWIGAFTGDRIAARFITA